MNVRAIAEAGLILARSSKSGYAAGISMSFSAEARQLAEYISRAAVTDIGTPDAGWLNAVSPFQAYAAVWLASLKTESFVAAVIARQLVNVIPFYTAAVISSGGFVSAAPGEGRAVLTSKITVGRQDSSPVTVTSLTAISDELIDTGGPAVIGLVDTEMRAEMGVQTDRYGYAQLSDSSTDHGNASGTTSISAFKDLRGMMKSVYAGQNPRRFFWVIGVQAIIDAITLTDSVGGDPAFPNLELTGGSIFGAPCFVSGGIPADALILCDGSQIAGALNDLGLSASRNAALEMSDSPTQFAGDGTGAQLTSLYQTHAVGLKAVTRLFFDRLRPSACSILRQINWSD